MLNNGSLMESVDDDAPSSPSRDSDSAMMVPNVTITATTTTATTRNDEENNKNSNDDDYNNNEDNNNNNKLQQQSAYLFLRCIGCDTTVVVVRCELCRRDVTLDLRL